MKEVPKEAEILYDEKGISIIDTDAQGRIQTSLEHTLNLIFKCMDKNNLEYMVSKRGLQFLIDSMVITEPNLERDYQSPLYKKLSEIFQQYGKEKIKVSRGSKSLKDYIILINPRTRDAIATNILKEEAVYDEQTGERMIKCAQNPKAGEIRYERGVSPIDTDIQGKPLSSFAHTVNCVYNGFRNTEEELSPEVAEALLDQIAEDDKKISAMRPSQRILALYRPGVAVSALDVKHPERLVFSYQGSSACVIDSMWSQKKDGRIYSNYGSSMVLTDIEELAKIKSGEVKATATNRKYHTKGKKSIKGFYSDISKHLKYTMHGYKWYTQYKRALNYIRQMEGTLSIEDTGEQHIYDPNFEMTPNNLKDKEVEKWIVHQCFLARDEKSNFSNHRRATVLNNLEQYSFGDLNFEWNCKAIRAYQDNHNGKNPTKSTNAGLSNFINNSGITIKRIVDHWQEGTLTEQDQKRFRLLSTIGLADRVISSCELREAIAEYNRVKEDKTKQLDAKKEREANEK